MRCGLGASVAGHLRSGAALADWCLLGCAGVTIEPAPRLASALAAAARDAGSDTERALLFNVPAAACQHQKQRG